MLLTGEVMGESVVVCDDFVQTTLPVGMPALIVRTPAPAQRLGRNARVLAASNVKAIVTHSFILRPVLSESYGPRVPARPLARPWGSRRATGAPPTA